MKDDPRPRHDRSTSLDRRIDRDLEALAARSAENPRPLTETLHTLSGRRSGRRWEERFMAWTGFWKMRPRLATAAVVVLAAAALLVVPVSYTKVVGHEITLNLDGKGMSREVVGTLAGQFKSALHADAVQVAAGVEDGAATYTFTARAAGRDAPAAAEAFAHNLTGKGYTARAVATPIRERVSGNVYAMAYDNVIRVSVDGKSADELETEIADALAAAGVPNAQVSVTMDGDNGSPNMKIEVKATGDCDPDAAGSEPQLVLTADGKDLGGDTENVNVRMKKAEAADGTVQLQVEVTRDGTVYTATVENAESLSDADLAAAVHDQLAAQGVDLSVSSQDGRVQVLGLGATGGAEPQIRKTTWGRLKQEMKDRNH